VIVKGCRCEGDYKSRERSPSPIKQAFKDKSPQRSILSMKSSKQVKLPDQCGCRGDRKKRWNPPTLDAGESIVTTIKGEGSVLSIASRGSIRASSIANSIDRTDNKACSCYGHRKDRHHGQKPSPPKIKKVIFV
jgi:hypothetical protein